ncbi:hypothetical protein KCG48_11835 [Proteiniclasticum sp. BAD-10]|uniref:Uncharacterized protein n=1 Tax=Proteiniclasticum sediminis TaxID=2804028 RepID=A0A941CQF4_9CLOT|nr:hypothetical protein [Proteiniclasticum sediminis]MBR0577006.1 hypothetical protein [Proteiniclasticum sediminis]
MDLGLTRQVRTLMVAFEKEEEATAAAAEEEENVDFHAQQIIENEFKSQIFSLQMMKQDFRRTL